MSEESFREYLNELSAYKISDLLRRLQEEEEIISIMRKRKIKDKEEEE